MTHYGCSLCRFWPVNCIFWPIETLHELAVPPLFWPVNCIKNRGSCCTAKLPVYLFPILWWNTNLYILIFIEKCKYKSLCTKKSLVENRIKNSGILYCLRNCCQDWYYRQEQIIHTYYPKA